MELDDDMLQQVYTWVDEIPLSRPKKNISRDFSDAVLMAEVVAHFVPKIVEMHNYSQANSVRQKIYNWQTLNQKVLKKLGMQLSMQEVEDLVNCKPNAVESVLLRVQTALREYKTHRRARETSSPRSARDTPPAAARGGGGGAGVAAGPYAAVSAAAAAPAAAAVVAAAPAGHGVRVDPDVLAEKDQTIAEYKEMTQILELKIKKLEQLVRLKDSRIQTLSARLQSVQYER